MADLLISFLYSAASSDSRSLRYTMAGDAFPRFLGILSNANCIVGNDLSYVAGKVIKLLDKLPPVTELLKQENLVEYRISILLLTVGIL